MIESQIKVLRQIIEDWEYIDGFLSCDAVLELNQKSF